MIQSQLIFLKECFLIAVEDASKLLTLENNESKQEDGLLFLSHMMCKAWSIDKESIALLRKRENLGLSLLGPLKLHNQRVNYLFTNETHVGISNASPKSLLERGPMNITNLWNVFVFHNNIYIRLYKHPDIKVCKNMPSLHTTKMLNQAYDFINHQTFGNMKEIYTAAYHNMTDNSRNWRDNDIRALCFSLGYEDKKFGKPGVDDYYCDVVLYHPETNEYRHIYSDEERCMEFRKNCYVYVGTDEGAQKTIPLYINQSFDSMRMYNWCKSLFRMDDDDRLEKSTKIERIVIS
jgi:hypothetical protein